jgi:hypothetical protein
MEMRRRVEVWLLTVAVKTPSGLCSTVIPLTSSQVLKKIVHFIKSPKD